MPSFFQKGYSKSPEGLRLQKSAGYINAGTQAFNILNSAYGATNKIGNTFSSIGGILGSIPNPYTATLGAALGVAGGVANTFTDTVNEDYVNQIGSQISNLAGTTSEARDFSTLQQSYRDLAGSHIDLGSIDNWGSVGIFGSGRKRERARATAVNALETAKLSALGNLNQQGRNINQTNFANQYSQMLAFGGPITGAIDYANMMDYTSLKQEQLNNKLLHAFGGDLMTNGATWDNGFTYVGNGGSHESNPNEGVQVGVDPQGIPNLVEEGEVIWNDYVFSKRLKVPKSFKDKYKFKDGGSISFADAAKKFAEENKERPNDPISKKGRDALLTALMDQQEEVRAKKQQKEARAQFNSLTPDEQLGIMQMAQQNAVPAGSEDEYNNMEENPMMMEEAPMMAAFGGRIFAGGGLKSYKKKTDIEKNLPWLRNLYVTDPNDTKAWDALFDNSGNIIATKGGTTGLYDPNGAYMKALSSLSADNWSKWSDAQKQQFVTNLKTINPTKYKNYTVDNVGKDAWSWDNLRALASDGYVGGHHQVAQFASEITPPATNPARKTANRFFLRTTDAQGNPIASLINGLPDIYEGYSTTTGQTWDEAIAAKGFTRVGTSQKSSEGDTDYTDYFFQKKAPVTTPTPQEDTKITIPLNLQQTTSRYMPVIGAGIGVLTDALGITNTPDFSSAQAIKRAAERVGTPSLISARPIGNRLTYKPFDLNYYANQARSNAALTGRSIMNQSSGNIGATTAGLLALGQNTTTQMGDLFRKAEEYNLEQKAKVADFNRATDMFNAQQELTAARANQVEKRQASAAYAAGIAQAEALRQRAQQYSDTSRSTNLTNFLQGLGDIGNENEQRNWLKTLYATNYFGNSPIMERVLYSDSDVLANFMRNNPNAKVDDVVSATGINKSKVKKYFKKKGLTI